jgi:cytochrome c peroxidase
MLRTLTLDGTEALEPIGEASTVATEPLSAELLLGARLFDDSADPRLSRDGYIACAHCHLDGLDDHRTWDFTDRGEGLRNTIDLSGRMGEGHGPIHWSGNFDELEDFENDLRGAFRGTGLLSDADFAAHEATLGTPKRGLGAELDALAAYIRTLPMHRSPYRRDDGSLDASAERGRALFLDPARGCTICHGGAELTDSAFVSPGTPRLHDVGTLGTGSGMRLGGPLPGIDTPTLRGLFLSAPYLHDGSAPTLRAVLRDRNPDDRHGVTSDLSDAQLEDLVAYLLSLE